MYVAYCRLPPLCMLSSSPADCYQSRICPADCNLPRICTKKRQIVLRAALREPSESKDWIDRKKTLGIFHEKGDLVSDKYKIIGVLGQGGVGVTYEAQTNGDTVAIKAMSLRNMKGWKDLDLFEREARVLKSLKHPGIPEYIDFFEVETEEDKAFYIVQKVAKGKSIAKLVEEGWRVSEDEVKRIAIEILEVLKYLGSLRPPVIHRDIKPENIILDEATGRVKVVDFGAVQDAASSSATFVGSTVVGTYGYMAPEQFQNRATMQTDLYGLGGTILFMLSGRSPAAFPQKRLKVDFQDSVPMTVSIARVVERLLEPAPEDRYQTAGEVILALQDNEPSLTAQSDVADRPVTSKKPYGSKISFQRTANVLSIAVPPAGLRAATATGTFAVAWNSFLVLWTSTALAGGAPLLFTLFSVPFWFVGYGLAKDTLASLTVTTHLEFKKDRFSIEWRVGDYWTHRVDGRTEDILSVDICVEMLRNRRRIMSISIKEGVRSHDFGESLQLVEKNWLVAEICSFLGLPPPPVVEQGIVDQRVFWDRDRYFYDDFW